MTQLIRVTIDSIQVMDDPRQSRVIILKEQDQDRFLQIWTSPFEGELIRLHMKGAQTNRPLTFDLLKSLIDLSDLRIKQVAISKMLNDIFYATITITRCDAGSSSEVDCRPSDAIAIALKMQVPIFVASEVMDSCGKPSPQPPTRETRSKIQKSLNRRKG